METYANLCQHLAKFFLGWQKFQIKFVQKIKTRRSCPTQFNENRAVYDIITKNTAEPDCATSRRVPGSIPGHWGFFPGHQTVPCALGSTQLLKMGTRIFLGVKTAGA